MQTMLDPLALYAAVLSTALAGWQIYTWNRERATVLEVRLAHAFPTEGPEFQHWLSIEAINRSSHAIRVTSAGFYLQDGSNRSMVITAPLPWSTIPGEVLPHDSGAAFILAGDAQQGGIDIYRPLQAWVNTADGHTFVSKSKTLMSH